MHQARNLLIQVQRSVDHWWNWKVIPILTMIKIHPQLFMEYKQR
ncbi:UNVERIFIED_CONTAM: hypothetical protein NCL1_37722 [Trichonephila clavipes]